MHIFETNFKIESRLNDMESLLKDETIFVQSNGVIGSRNHFTEGYGAYDYPVTLMNGFYNTYPFKYEENYKQFPQVGETIVNLPDTSRIDIYFNHQPVHLSHMTLESTSRVYDLLTGVVKRQSVYKQETLKITVIEEKIVAHEKNLIMVKMTIKANQSGQFDFVSKLRMPRLANHANYDPRLAHSKKHLNIISMNCGLDFGSCMVETTHTNQKLNVQMTHDIDVNYEQKADEIHGSFTKTFTDEPIVFTKYTSYTLSQSEGQNNAYRLNKESFEHRYGKEYKRLIEFWKNSYVHIDNPTLDSIMKYNVYMLHHQSPSDTYHSIAAKGITGEGYEGHYFWDTETYMLPYFILTNPQKAKALLTYRYHILDKARVEAKNLGTQRGAKMPWRTISGQESSPYFPAGSAQIHINSDIALAIINYYYATKDDDFMMDYGLELLIETGLFMLEYGHFHQGQFHLFDVTGPDEYTAIVNDNYYTNRLAKMHLSFTYDYILGHIDSCQSLLEKLGISQTDLDQFNLAANQMTLLKDEALGIWKQDDSFLQKKPLPIDDIPKTTFPLLLHYHPLYIYRHQVLKQADTVLAMILENHEIDDVFKRTTDYYLKRTTHDSSLSKCAYGIAKYRLGETKEAFEYFNHVATLDFLDHKKHTKHGLHMANAGGSYLMVMYGLLGLSFSNVLSISPVKQTEIKFYEVHFEYQGSRLSVTYENHALCLKTDKPIQVRIYDEEVTVKNQLILSVK